MNRFFYSLAFTLFTLAHSFKISRCETGCHITKLQNKRIYMISNPIINEEGSNDGEKPKSGLITNPEDFNSITTDEREHDDAIGAPVGPLPSVSSMINVPTEQTSENLKYDLWIVGAGTLGEYVIKQYKAMFPDAVVVAETSTTTRHTSLLSQFPTNLQVRLKENRSEIIDAKSAKNVIICFPPSQSKEFVDEISSACRIWAGSVAGGNLVYSSSIGVYGDSIGNTVNEDFRVDTRSKSSTKLLAAEEAILNRGGRIVRLAGLYTSTRGPHSYWMRKSIANETIDGSANGLINMLHYEDAASAMIATMNTKGTNRKVFLACDDEPVSRREICESTLVSKLYPTATMPKFQSENGPQTKICDSSITRSLINWKPKYPSFRIFMRELGGEICTPLANNDIKKDKKSVLWIPGNDDDDLF
eukprot:gene11506-15412_t